MNQFKSPTPQHNVAQLAHKRQEAQDIQAGHKPGFFEKLTDEFPRYVTLAGTEVFTEAERRRL
jgi:hypothetical protein